MVSRSSAPSRTCGQRKVTYEVGLSSLCELLFSGSSNSGIWEQSVIYLGRYLASPATGNVPAEKVFRSTWLTSMMEGHSRCALSSAAAML